MVEPITPLTPEYRIRIGNWRVLFEIEAEKIIVYRFRHRREAYK